MATFVRNRVLNQLVWSAEEERQRVQRRETLCELDGLLTQLEEVNLRGGPIPTRVLVALRRRGVTFRPRTSAAELIEACGGMLDGHRFTGGCRCRPPGSGGGCRAAG